VHVMDPHVQQGHSQDLAALSANENQDS